VESCQTKANHKLTKANCANGTTVLIGEERLSKSSGLLERWGAYSYEISIRNRCRKGIERLAKDKSGSFRQGDSTQISK